jgi:hypothetical protein
MPWERSFCRSQLTPCASMTFSASSLECCHFLGISDTTLRKFRVEGILQPGTHFRVIGLGRVKPRLRWNLEACEQTLARASKRFVG